MPKQKKRPSKAAKAAQKIVTESKLLAAGKTARETSAAQEFKPETRQVGTSEAIKARPHKKRG